MTDGSYIQVCSEIYPGKVTWIGGDHSAITTATPGRWKSKWNKYPLIEHNKDDTPFGSTYAYYASTKIAGSTSNLCSGTRDFIVQNISGATYIWSYSSSLSVSGPTNTNQLTVSRIGNSNGAAWVEVQISTPCSGSSVTNRLNFSIGVPDINNFDFVVSGPSCIASNYQSVSFGLDFNGYTGCQLKDNAGITEVEWNVICSYPHQVAYNAGAFTCQNPAYVNKAGLSVAFSYPTQPYVITFLYRVKNDCGWSEWSPGNYHFVQACGGGWRFITSPNPTNGTMLIALDEETIRNDKTSNVREIHVFDKFGNVVKKFIFGSGNKKATINISELKPDNYFIKVFNGNEWKGQSIIKQ